MDFEEKGKGREVVTHYARGKINLNKKEYTFYYPKGFRWSCKYCGACCKDTKHRPRRILLLGSDIKRLEDAGEGGITIPVEGREPFKAEMKRKGGICINLTEKGCRIYSSRTLLCRMYPFWVEKERNTLEIMVDSKCPGIGKGPGIQERYFREMLEAAVSQIGDP